MRAPMSFSPLPMDELNSFGYGMKQGSDIAAQQAMNILNAQRAQQMGIQNQYLPQSLQANILQTQLANQKSQAQLPYAGPQAAADLRVTQAQPGLMGAQAALASSEANKNRFLTQNPLFMAPSGDVGVLAASRWMQTHPNAQTDSQFSQNNQGYTGGGNTAPPAQGQGPLTSLGQPQQPPIWQSQQQSPGGLNPNAIMNQLATTGTYYNPAARASAELQAPQAREMINEARQESDNQRNIENLAGSFVQNYMQSKFTGPGTGQLPTSGIAGFALSKLGNSLAPERATDTFGNQLATAIAEQQKLYGGHMTQGNLSLIKSLKLQRDMPPETVMQLYNYSKMLSQRGLEKTPFVTSLLDSGAKPQDVENAWQDYNNKFPLTADGVPLPQNVGRYQDYIKAGGRINGVTSAPSPMQKGGGASLGSMGNAPIMMRVGNQTGPVSPSKMAKFLQDHPNAVRAS